MVEYNIKDGNNEDEIVNMIDNVSNEDIITSGKNEEENKKNIIQDDEYNVDINNVNNHEEELSMSILKKVKQIKNIQGYIA